MHTQTKRELGVEILRQAFTDRPRVAIAEIVATGRARDVSRRTLTRAARHLGIVEVHNGPFGAFWEKP